MNVLATGLFGYDFRTYDMSQDLIYSDEDDEDDGDDDDDDDPFNPNMAARKPLEPHPRITQLTDEEADRHAQELIAEEERRKEKTERNKRKKMEEDQGKSDSENQDENPIFESNAESNEFPECDKSQNEPAAAGGDESSGNNKEENLVKTNNKEEKEEEKEGEEQKDLDLNNSYASTAKSVPEETCNQTPAKDTKEEKVKLPEAPQLKEEKPKIAEKNKVQQKKEEKHEPSKEKTIDPTVEEYARRSRELAGTGNRLAASGQYEMAVKCFTDAIKFNPKELRLFGNRSLCYERLQQYENALRDADVALSMEPNWRYYEASLIYRQVLDLESSSAEAMQELKRAQTLHLMEMGFTWAQSTEALKAHTTLEEAVDALFSGNGNQAAGDAAASFDNTDQPVVLVEDEDDGEWIVRQSARTRPLQVRDADALDRNRSKSQSPTPHSRSSVKPELFSIWVGSLAPAVTYAILHELFSRVGAVYSIKMLLEQQCAFVNYTRKEDCDRAIQCFNGMVLEGAPLAVRYPSRHQNGPGTFKSASTDPFLHSVPYKKECFFWRTTGCTRQDCTFRHVPEHKNIDKDKFTGRLGRINM
ncbi:hypothetical protein INR49_002232 [Caranx melampygus]|nr:hypothetical protein INR49_002232 [Caranx melampygus]